MRGIHKQYAKRIQTHRPVYIENRQDNPCTAIEPIVRHLELTMFNLDLSLLQCGVQCGVQQNLVFD